MNILNRKNKKINKITKVYNLAMEVYSFGIFSSRESIYEYLKIKKWNIEDFTIEEHIVDEYKYSK